MASSLAEGPLFRFLRVARRLTIKTGGRLRIESADIEPENPVKGDLYVNDDGVLLIYNGTDFVAVGSQSIA